MPDSSQPAPPPPAPCRDRCKKSGDPVRAVARLLLANDPMSWDLEELFALDGEPLTVPEDDR